MPCWPGEVEVPEPGGLGGRRFGRGRAAMTAAGADARPAVGSVGRERTAAGTQTRKTPAGASQRRRAQRYGPWRRGLLIGTGSRGAGSGSRRGGGHALRWPGGRRPPAAAGKPSAPSASTAKPRLAGDGACHRARLRLDAGRACRRCRGSGSAWRRVSARRRMGGGWRRSGGHGARRRFHGRRGGGRRGGGGRGGGSGPAPLLGRRGLLHPLL